MSIRYQPLKLHLAGLRDLDEAGTQEERNAIFRSTFEDLTDWLVNEHKRLATSTNSAAGEFAGYRTISADSLVASTDRTVVADTTAAGVTATLPLAREYPGLTVAFKRIAGANPFTVAARGSDTVDGGASVTVTTPRWFQADAVNANWVEL